MKLRKGSKPLSETHPELAKLWDYDMNGDLTPENISAGSNKVAYWVCPVHGSYPQLIANKTRKDVGCPYCSGRLATKETSLATVYPEIANLWDYEMNGYLTPDKVLPNSRQNVWWKCPKHGSYNQKINNKVANNTDCPICKAPDNTKLLLSVLDDRGIKYTVNKTYPDQLGKKRFTVYIPDMNLLIDLWSKSHQMQLQLKKGSDYDKIQFSKENNQPMVIIPYQYFDRIDKIVDDITNKYNLPDVDEKIFHQLTTITTRMLMFNKYE